MVEVLEDLYKQYVYYIDTIDNIYFEGVEGKKKMNDIMEKLRGDSCISFEGFELKRIEDYLKGYAINIGGKKEKIKLPKSNVLKFIFSDGSWFVLRPSGTEPKMKVYTEAITSSYNDSSELCNKIRTEVLNYINEDLK